ncbi:MAG: hypothetical protein N2043_09705 [Ignavibacterium sp.]|nr:hypothetical protein [Ignavibacterium sp.]
MLRQIFEALKVDFQKINRDNGFNTDVKYVTTKSINPQEINYSITPAIELFFINNSITPYDGVNYYDTDIGVLCYLKPEKTLDDGSRTLDLQLMLIEDFENLLKYDLAVMRVPGVERLYWSEYTTIDYTEDNLIILFLKLRINYAN